MGFYTEMLFPEKGKRFIAINNGMGREIQGENDFTSFRNIMNEWYAKDTSKRIRTMFKAKMQEGKRVSPSVPYGYLRDPENKQHLIVDGEAAEVVMRKSDRLAADFPDTYKLIGQTDIDKIYSMPKSYVTYCKPRKISDEQRNTGKVMEHHFNGRC